LYLGWLLLLILFLNKKLKKREDFIGSNLFI
jgi:hypothetical protein